MNRLGAWTRSDAQIGAVCALQRVYRKSAAVPADIADVGWYPLNTLQIEP